MLADVAALSSLTVRAAGVVTALTIQRPAEEVALVAVDPTYVKKALDQLSADLPLAAVKIGMLGSDAVAEVPLRLSSGKVVAFKTAAASGAEMLVVTVLISPKKEGDRNYYELKVGDIQLKAVKGPKAGRVVPIYGLRFADEEAFHKPVTDEVLTVRGEKELQIAFYVTKDREEMSLTVKGFKAMDVELGR